MNSLRNVLMLPVSVLTHMQMRKMQMNQSLGVSSINFLVSGEPIHYLDKKLYLYLIHTLPYTWLKLSKPGSLTKNRKSPKQWSQERAQFSKHVDEDLLKCPWRSQHKIFKQAPNSPAPNYEYIWTKLAKHVKESFKLPGPRIPKSRFQQTLKLQKIYKPNLQKHLKQSTGTSLPCPSAPKLLTHLQHALITPEARSPNTWTMSTNQDTWINVF